jgi:hypothetical protein
MIELVHLTHKSDDHGRQRKKKDLLQIGENEGEIITKRGIG